MTLRKLTQHEWLQSMCVHREHEPPRYIVLEPGMYEHTCPGCKRKTYFRVVGVTW